MKIFKKSFRKLAVVFVSLWARLAYSKGVIAAEERRKREMQKPHWETGNCKVYLACNSFRPDRLVTYTRRQFKYEKKVYGRAAQLLTINTLSNGCYYYTADRYGGNAMSEREKDIRRKAFIKERLRLAGLLR